MANENVTYNTHQENICRFIAAYLVYDIVSLGVNSLVNKFISYGAIWDSAILLLVMMYLLLKTIISGRLKVRKEPFICFCVMLITYIGSIVLHPDVISLISYEGYQSIALGFLLLVLVAGLDNYQYLYECLKKVYWIAILCGCIHLFFSEKTGVYSIWMSDMTAGYSMLIITLFAIDYSFQNKIAIIPSVVACVSIVGMGSRGPVLMVMIFGIVCIFRYAKDTKKKLALILTIAVLGYVIVSGLYLDWLLRLSTLLKTRGYTLASLEKILNYQDFSNGRSDIWNLLIQQITDHPILGNGIFADRQENMAYAHNMITEMLFDYGIFLGSIWVVWICIKTFRTIIVAIVSGNDCYLSIVLIVIIGAFGKLMLSSSYLIDPLFYFAIGLLCNCYMTRGSKFVYG